MCLELTAELRKGRGMTVMRTSFQRHMSRSALRMGLSAALGLVSSSTLLAAPVVPSPDLDLLHGPPSAPGKEIDPTDYGRFIGSGQYRRCVELIPGDADAAFGTASTWAEQGGGAPALHCAALALLDLGHEADAARRLENLARAPGAGDVPLRMEILGQAGNAWMIAGDPSRAADVFTAGITLGQGIENTDPTTLIYDRARARALLEEWQAVETDLSFVLAKRPGDLSALVLRSAARRSLDRIPQAREDVAAALAIAPEDPAALIERGQLARVAGDPDAARRDWIQAAVAGEGTPLAEAAQALLEALDLMIEESASQEGTAP